MTDILRNSNGRKVDFKNTVIVQTCAGANRIIAPKHLEVFMDDTR